VEFLELPFLLAAAALVVYVLAILLRVSCHFCGVEIPALGRAYFTAAVSAGLSVVAAYFILAFLFGPSSRGPNLILKTLAAVLMLVANGAISTGIYAPLLDVRIGRALTIWLVQAICFLAFGLLGGCCAGLVSLIG